METKQETKKNKFANLPPMNMVITRIIGKTDENDFYTKVEFKTDKGEKITWTPEIVLTSEKNGRVVEKTIRDGITDALLPAILNDMGKLIKVDGKVQINASVSTTTNEKGNTYMFFSQSDFNTIEIVN